MESLETSQEVCPEISASQSGTGLHTCDTLLYVAIIDGFPINVVRENPSAMERVLQGGYPESLHRSHARREVWFQGYLNGVLQREVLDIARILDATKLQLLVTMLAGRSTQAINKTMLSRDLGVSWNTVEHYLAILQTTFLLTSIPAWVKHVNPRVLGTIFETFVGNELLRLTSLNPYAWQIAHYRTQRNEEVDFVVEGRDGSIVGVEVKLSNTVTASDFRGLRALQRDAGERFVRGIVLYTGEATAPFGEPFAAVPVTALWATPNAPAS